MTQNTISVPPTWDNIGKHEVFPETTHDERARYNFLASLNKHMSGMVAPGNRLAYDNRVKPQHQSDTGQDFSSRDEVHHAMLQDPYFQAWSALRRSTMEMRQQAGRSITLRQADTLAEKAEALNAGKATLMLDESVRIPAYLMAVDNHLMPGSYHTEYCESDVSAAANYDTGLFVTTAGLLGRYSDGGGKAIAQWVKTTHPDFHPKRILDIGCGMGHNVLPIARLFPDAEVIAIDTGVPMLRYGHARAQSLGYDNVTFRQMDAADMSAFADESFDWIQTTMFLHETGGKSIHKIMAEIYRLLKPGGLTMHIEQPQYTPEMDYFEQFIRDWDAFYNSEPFWSKMHDLAPVDLLTQAGFSPDRFMQIGVKAMNDLDDGTQKDEPEDYGRSPVWNVFGTWK